MENEQRTEGAWNRKKITKITKIKTNQRIYIYVYDYDRHKMYVHVEVANSERKMKNNNKTHFYFVIRVKFLFFILFRRNIRLQRPKCAAAMAKGQKRTHKKKSLTKII